MKIEFSNIFNKKFIASLEKNNVKFSITAFKLSEKKVKCLGTIKGNLVHFCDRCGNEFFLHVNEDIEVLVCDGIAEPSDKLENSIEFFDGFIDFDEIFISELEAIKSDYYYCENCKI